MTVDPELLEGVPDNTGFYWYKYQEKEPFDCNNWKLGEIKLGKFGLYLDVEQETYPNEGFFGNYQWSKQLQPPQEDDANDGN